MLKEIRRASLEDHKLDVSSERELLHSFERNEGSIELCCLCIIR
jgi:hypothetical protein